MLGNASLCNRTSEGEGICPGPHSCHRVLPRAHCPSPGKPSQLTVGVCVDGFHEEGISSIQALLQAGSGVLWPSRVQACKDRLMSRPPSLPATGTLMDPQHTYLGSHSDSVSLNKDPKDGKLTQSPITRNLHSTVCNFPMTRLLWLSNELDNTNHLVRLNVGDFNPQEVVTRALIFLSSYYVSDIMPGSFTHSSPHNTQ